MKHAAIGKCILIPSACLCPSVVRIVVRTDDSAGAILEPGIRPAVPIVLRDSN